MISATCRYDHQNNNNNNNNELQLNHRLAEIVDVLPPTRLLVAYTAAPSPAATTRTTTRDRPTSSHNTTSVGDDDLGWEVVRQSTDHVDFHDNAVVFFSGTNYNRNRKKDNYEDDENDAIMSSKSNFYARVWKWQRDVAFARETYVSCSDEHAARTVRRLYDDVMMMK
jgi:hypothetical protein